MSEFFTRPPEIPEEELNAPRIILPETALTRTVATVLMMIWAWWWWNGHADGAYWVIPAVAILAAGEVSPHWFRPVVFLWWPLSFVVRPIVWLILTVTRAVVPVAYRKRQQVLKPLSFKEINAALDEAREEKERREREEKSRDGD
jgi:Mg2+/Co2+ transporter CorB